MHIIAKVLVTAMATAVAWGVLADNVVIGDIDDLAKTMLEYNKLFAIEDKDGISDGNVRRQYSDLRNAINKHFNDRPEDFLKLNSSVFHPESFAFVVLPEHRVAGKVYCDILRKIIDNMDGDGATKKIYFLEWGASGLAGFEPSLELMRYVESLPGPNFKELQHPRSKESVWRRNKDYHKIFLDIMNRIEAHIAMHNDLVGMSKEKLARWRTYGLWFDGQVYDKIMKELEESERKIRAKYYRDPSGAEKLDEEQLAAMEAEIKSAEVAISNTAPKGFWKLVDDYDYHFNPRCFQDMLMPFMKDRHTPVADGFDFPAIAHHVAAQGNRIPRDYQSCVPDMPYALVVMEDPKGVPRYVIAFIPPTTHPINVFILYHLLYDENGNPNGVAKVWVNVDEDLRPLVDKYLKPIFTRL
jgi:hypothetical protein